MADTKQLKSKLQATTNINKITNALEIFSTIKLQKTKKSAIHIRECMLALVDLLAQIDDEGTLFAHPNLKDTEKELVVVIWSDKGLCGSLNTTLFKKIHATFEEKKDNIDLYIIGKKTKEYFSRRKYSITWETFLRDDVSLEKCNDVLMYIQEKMTLESYKKIYICYNIFKNTMKYIPVIFSLFPLNAWNFNIFLEGLKEENLWLEWYSTSPWTLGTTLEKKMETKMEPSKEIIKDVIRSMVMRYIVYGSLLQNKTCEFAARMIAMKWAKDNATEQINTLTIAYNKARQDSTTKEIIEIAGAKAIITW